MANPAFATANTTATLAADVADAGTVTVPYPAGFVQADLTGSTGGMVVVNDNDVWPQGTGAGTVAFTFGASNITVTNGSGETWPAGSKLILSFGTVDYSDSLDDAALEARAAALESRVAALESRVAALEAAAP